MRAALLIFFFVIKWAGSHEPQIALWWRKLEFYPEVQRLMAEMFWILFQSSSHSTLYQADKLSFLGIRTQWSGGWKFVRAIQVLCIRVQKPEKKDVWKVERYFSEVIAASRYLLSYRLWCLLMTVVLLSEVGFINIFAFLTEHFTVNVALFKVLTAYM